MQTFTFDELDARGQEVAITRYGSEYLEETDQHGEMLALNFDGYRFNIHGERIA